MLVAHGLARKGDLVKVLGRGTLARAMQRVGARASRPRRKAAIEAAGGTTTELDKPFSVRPPASGNQHQNR